MTAKAKDRVSWLCIGYSTSKGFYFVLLRLKFFATFYMFVLTLIALSSVTGVWWYPRTVLWPERAIQGEYLMCRTASSAPLPSVFTWNIWAVHTVCSPTLLAGPLLTRFCGPRLAWIILVGMRHACWPNGTCISLCGLLYFQYKNRGDRQMVLKKPFILATLFLRLHVPIIMYSSYLYTSTSPEIAAGSCHLGCYVTSPSRLRSTRWWSFYIKMFSFLLPTPIVECERWVEEAGSAQTSIHSWERALMSQEGAVQNFLASSKALRQCI